MTTGSRVALARLTIVLTESAAGAEAGLDSGAEVGVAVSKDWADGTKSVTLATS